MKKFMLKFFQFSIIFVVISLGYNKFYVTIVIKNSILNRTQVQFDKNVHYTKILFVGDSHAKMAVNPELLKNSFNFTSFEESYLQTFYKVKKIVQHHKSVDYVVLPIDLHSFSSFRKYTIHNDAYWNKYINYFELARETKEIQFIYKWIKGSLFEYVGHFGHLQNYVASLIKNKKYRSLLLGYVLEYADFSRSNEKEEIAKKRVRYHFEGSKCLDDTLLAYFEKTLKICEENKVKVILITYPVTERYYNFASEVCPIKDFDSKIYTIISKYPNITLKLNYLKLYYDNDEYFRDSDHLNNVGAVKFTNILSQIIPST